MGIRWDRSAPLLFLSFSLSRFKWRLGKGRERWDTNASKEGYYSGYVPGWTHEYLNLRAPLRPSLHQMIVLGARIICRTSGRSRRGSEPPGIPPSPCETHPAPRPCRWLRWPHGRRCNRRGGSRDRRASHIRSSSGAGRGRRGSPARPDGRAAPCRRSGRDRASAGSPGARRPG